MNCPNCQGTMHKAQVKKEGPNRGRWFYSCDDQECGGFKWAEDKKEKQTNGKNDLAMMKMNAMNNASNIVMAKIQNGNYETKDIEDEFELADKMFEWLRG